jgi:hypothetical protein
MIGFALRWLGGWTWLSLDTSLGFPEQNLTKTGTIFNLNDKNVYPKEYF